MAGTKVCGSCQWFDQETPVRTGSPKDGFCKHASPKGAPVSGPAGAYASFVAGM